MFIYKMLLMFFSSIFIFFEPKARIAMRLLLRRTLVRSDTL